MVDAEADVRVEEQIKVKIGEAKNICPRNGSSNGVRDVCCALCLDKEIIFRTSVVEKTLNPFFGQEFQFDIPRPFRNLTFYLYDKERTINKDKIIGKVAIRRDDLKKYNNKEKWFTITAVDEDSEVQGKINLDIRLENCVSGQRLVVTIIECSDLGLVHSNSCDPYVICSLYQGLTCLGSKKTKTKKKTTSPQFSETFFFDLPIKGQNHDRNSFHGRSRALTCYQLRVCAMHDVGGVFCNTFLGEIKIALSDIDLERSHRAWYLLRPRDTAFRPEVKKIEKGSLRLKIQYTSDYVLSSRYYDPLRNLILSSIECKPVSSSTAYLLGEIVANKLEVAQPLVKIFIHYKEIVAFIRVLTERELSKVTDTTTIFRGNSLVSKSLDELMKLIGLRYLHKTLKPIVEQIINEKKPCEIDPSKLKETENLNENLDNLRNYINLTVNAISQSALECPQIMCELFGVLKELALKFFPDNREVCYSVISGFIFLRFFVPAILNPKLFELTDQQIDPQTCRTFTLISKTVQSIGNLVSSKTPVSSQLFKEDYMASLYKKSLTDQHIDLTRVFLELISSSAMVFESKLNETPIILKESVMKKRSQGRNKNIFRSLHFKKRYFCLTTQTFSYAKSKGQRPLCEIPITEILAVECLQEESFKLKNMFQVVQNDLVLYIQANNCVEAKEWIDILSKVCQTNKKRLTEYHPSAYIHDQWLCCNANNEMAPGCHPVSLVSVPADIGFQVDADREVARIHAILLNHLDTIEQLIAYCRCPSEFKLNDDNHAIQDLITKIEDRVTMETTLKNLKVAILTLEQSHNQYIRHKCVRTIYGSAEAPIGDDNYLVMLAKHLTT